jgi:hypothetical protein
LILGRSFTACPRRSNFPVPAGRPTSGLKVTPDAVSATSFSRPAGTGIPTPRLQAVNDLPKFSRRYAAKSCVETLAGKVAVHNAPPFHCFRASQRDINDSLSPNTISLRVG